jgi:hypothetical protein
MLSLKRGCAGLFGLRLRDQARDRGGERHSEGRDRTGSAIARIHAGLDDAIDMALIEDGPIRKRIGDVLPQSQDLLTGFSPQVLEPRRK